MKRKIIAGMVIFLILLLAVVGVTYGYFTANITKTKEENENTKIITTRLATATLEYGDTVESDLTVYPGRKFVKTIRVTSDGGDKPITGNITITPDIEDFGSHIKYSVYAVENPNEVDVENICGASNPIGNNGKYYDAMSCDTSDLGSVIQSGTLVHEEVTKVPIVIEGTTDRTYYVIIEYENDKENPQDSEQGKHFRIELGFEESIPIMSEYLIALSEIDNSLIKAEHQSTEQTGTNATIDYRYTGSDPNNYVYFGCDDTCTSDNLYRIIGVIPTQSSLDSEYEYRVKLIKNDFYTETESGYVESGSFAPGGYGYRWNKDNKKHDWNFTPLNTKVLNGVYWKNLGEYQKYIAPSVWYLGTGDYDYYSSYTPESFYWLERRTSKGAYADYFYTISNIGLMYPSDYAYSIDSIEWNQIIQDNAESYKTKAWLYHFLDGEYYEWTISPERKLYNSDYGAFAIDVSSYGFIYYHGIMGSTHIFGIRPTFYLRKDVLLQSGNGTLKDPYRVIIK